MTPLRRTLRNLLERLLKRFYEGPHPPPRIREEARLFALLNPHAGAEEWEEFAVRFAENCYRDGFVRGFEQSERDPDRIEPTPDEAILDAQRHDWSLAAEQGRMERLLREGVDPSDPMPGATSEERAAWLEEQAGVWGGFKVIALGILSEKCSIDRTPKEKRDERSDEAGDRKNEAGGGEGAFRS